MTDEEFKTEITEKTDEFREKLFFCIKSMGLELLSPQAYDILKSRLPNVTDMTLGYMLKELMREMEDES
jgi:hypothetical protein